jgi:hypothetical protein
VAIYVTGISTRDLHPESPPLLGTLTSVWRWSSASGLQPGLLFFDPDTGLCDPAFGLGRETFRHLSLRELDTSRVRICPNYRPAVVVYQHANRKATFRDDVVEAQRATGEGFCFFSSDVGFVVLAGDSDVGALRSFAEALARKWPQDVLGDAVVR